MGGTVLRFTCTARHAVNVAERDVTSVKGEPSCIGVVFPSCQTDVLLLSYLLTTLHHCVVRVLFR